MIIYLARLITFKISDCSLKIILQFIFYFLENNDQSDAIENVNGDDQKKPDHTVQSIIKKQSSEKHARFSVANVTREPGGKVESSNEEVFYLRFGSRLGVSMSYLLFILKMFSLDY